LITVWNSPSSVSTTSPAFLTGVLDDDHVLASGHLAADLEQLAQADEGQDFAAQVEIVAAARRVGEFDAFDDRVERHDVGRPCRRRSGSRR
jgi:hypothetical protein